jgi:hypothetical protein
MESAMRGNRVTMVLDRGNRSIVTDQSLIEVHADLLAGNVDNHRAYTGERAEGVPDGDLAGLARDLGYQNDR